ALLTSTAAQRILYSAAALLLFTSCEDSPLFQVPADICRGISQGSRLPPEFHVIRNSESDTVSVSRCLDSNKVEFIDCDADGKVTNVDSSDCAIPNSCGNGTCREDLGCEGPAQTELEERRKNEIIVIEASGPKAYEDICSEEEDGPGSLREYFCDGDTPFYHLTKCMDLGYQLCHRGECRGGPRDLWDCEEIEARGTAAQRGGAKGEWPDGRDFDLGNSCNLDGISATVFSCGELDVFEQQIDCISGMICQYGACVPGAQVERECEDSDGNNPNTAGHTEAVLANGENFSEDDYCTDEVTVVEWYCADSESNPDAPVNMPFWSTVPCDKGERCDHGACVPACGSCEDTDSTNAPFVRGTVTSPICETLFDFCVDGVLHQLDCVDGEIQENPAAEVVCENACEQGACK
ncbi:MAG: hypothetical protein Q7S68_02095, partial [Deltaproteobacteria bacterium]|nr:hypothetical protein [Deltaproteobacteria bacterium]